MASLALARLPPVSGGERLGVVAGEKHDVGWGPAGDLGDRGGDGRCLPAPVVRVVLEQALDLPGPPLASQLSAWARKHSLEADPATALRAVLAWSRLHGFVSLEIAGNYASMSIDPDQVFEIQLATLTA